MIDLTMVDSASGNFPPGFAVYAGYIDVVAGAHTASYSAAVTVARSEGARALSITTDSNFEADIFDIESGAESVTSAPAFFAKRTTPRPILYLSVVTVNHLVTVMEAHKITLHQYRILSAHYDWGRHFCGPKTCGYCTFTCAGTQWSGTAGGPHTYDLSILRGTFFDTEEQPDMIYGIVEYDKALWSVFATSGGVKKRHLGARTVTALTALGAKRLSGEPWTATFIASLPVAP